MEDLNPAGGQNVDGGAGKVDNFSKAGESVSIESHRRLLSQHKKMKDRLETLDASQKQSDLDRQIAEGKKDEAIQSLRDELTNEKSGRIGLLQKWTKRTIKDAVTKEALSRGLRPDKLEKFIKLSQDEFLGSDQLQIDEDFNIVNQDVFGNIMDQQTKGVEEWFTKTVDGPRDLLPGSVPATPQKSMNDMSVDELAEML